jgi:hypothetical protein
MILAFEFLLSSRQQDPFVLEALVGNRPHLEGEIWTSGGAWTRKRLHFSPWLKSHPSVERRNIGEYRPEF